MIGDQHIEVGRGIALEHGSMMPPDRELISAEVHHQPSRVRALEQSRVERDAIFGDDGVVLCQPATNNRSVVRQSDAGLRLDKRTGVDIRNAA